ncbi:MAG: hypothetical protein ACOCVN_00075 [bacterium]
MTDRQENALSMYYLVKRACTKFKPVWQDIPAFTDTVEHFTNLLGQIEAVRQVQEADTTGVTRDKNAREAALIEKALEASAALSVLADVQGNESLKARVEYSPSALKLSRDTELYDKCNLLNEEVKKQESVLPDYGFTAEDIEALNNRLTDYKIMLTAPTEAIKDRKAATEKLKELFQANSELLDNRLDKLVETLKSSNPDFYRTYQNARMVQHLGYGKSKQDENQ